MGLHIQPGDAVIVVLPNPSDKAVKMLLKFNRREFIVSKKISVSGYRTDKADTLHYYELIGAVSDDGIPYSFMPDWIIRA